MLSMFLYRKRIPYTMTPVYPRRFRNCGTKVSGQNEGYVLCANKTHTNRNKIKLQTIFTLV